ncbi:AfsR/SARP family transcriptional regulator [Streptomyces sp. SID4919]|uniref:AfsR/SARP family transcriptional regulator n=1 Tax=unclassified Streptomyces TaxID=2593676 RepID=UPI000823E448|nr:MULTISPECIES: BTAD domain-containing putative transcriptional regulator [unclassified Streptomyces]MYY09127.1 AfsR/SARP family transcriptional regulator [Streptomyces sp. SID4919]SCK29087.1 Predicted ATPase [Streptomyces sp. AmelKG-E11A]
MDLVRYRILGTTQASRADGTPLPVGGARLRALLTVLALRAGRTVPVAALVDEVWGDEPPADATAALQALVGRLRRTLGADAVESVERGYRLRAEPDDIDLHRFERLTGEGSRALADGDPAKAAAVLDDALALWRGPALADLPGRNGATARTDALRLSARRDRLTAVVALGDADRALPELTALCEAHPLDEPLQALRIRALRDTGRPAQALAAYGTVRETLAERLGTDPGPELRALHDALLRPPGARTAPPAPPRTAPRASAPPAAVPLGSAPPPVPPSPEPAPPSAIPPGPGSPDPVAPAAASPDLIPSDSASPDTVPRRTIATGRGSGTYLTGLTGRATGIAPAGPPAAPAGPTAPRDSAAAGRPTAPGRPAVPAAPGDSADSAAPADSAGPGRPAPVGPPAQGNLRARLTSFVGRERDLVAIRDDLGRARLITLLGPGGAGKTRLSQEAGESVAGDVPDGVWIAELAPVDDPDDVPDAVLTALGARQTVLRGAGAEEIRAVTERHPTEPLVRLAEHCASRRMLLILDNCEHVVGAAAHLAEYLLARCPGLTVLATSREPLGVPGESLRPVEPLPEPFAMRLFADRGAAARPGFRIADDPGAAAEICRRLDGLPLAIELAAARLRMLTPRQIADRLDDRFRLLTSGARTVLPRQQTLRAVVDWSWELLDGDERTVLRRLSVFAGGCDLAAAEDVCGPAALDALGSLVDKSLVVAAPGPDGPMRYRLLETVGEYAAEQLDLADDRTPTERAHLVHYREVARTTDPLLRGGGQPAAIRLLTTEYENLRTALRHAVAARDEQESLCLVLSLGWFWQIRDLRTDARNWSREAGALGPDPFAPPVTPALPLYEPVTAAPPPMRPEVLTEARRGVHLIQLACMDMDLDAWQNAGAQDRLRRVAATYRPGLPQTCRTPGYLWFFAVLLTGDLDQLHEVIDGTVRTCRDLGYAWELGQALQMRANILANRTEWNGDATRDADEALGIFLRLGDAWGAAESLSARGETYERRGDHARAAADFGAAIEHSRSLGAHAQVSVLSARLAGVWLETGGADALRGEELLRQVIHDNAEQGNNGAMPTSRLFLAMYLGRTGRRAEAREHLRLLREKFTAAGFVVFDGFITGIEAWLDILDREFDAGLAKVRIALVGAADPMCRIMAPHLGAQHLLTGALALAQRDDGARARDAALLLGASRALLPARHCDTVADRETWAAAEKATRAALDPEVFDAAFAEGAGLTLETASALV